MLLGFPVVVHTDHKNLVYSNETSLRVEQWKLLLSEYRLTMTYIKGEKNIETDAFSRMRSATSDDPSLNDEVYTLNTISECVMHGPVICQHQENDEMIASIRASCLAGTNNPDYQLTRLLGCTLLGYKHDRLVPHESRPSNKSPAIQNDAKYILLVTYGINHRRTRSPMQ